MTELVDECHSIVSCLGHNMTWKGIYGQPRKLVADATHRLCDAITANRPEQKIKYVLMQRARNKIPCCSFMPLLQIRAETKI